MVVSGAGSVPALIAHGGFTSSIHPHASGIISTLTALSPREVENMKFISEKVVRRLMTEFLPSSRCLSKPMKRDGKTLHKSEKWCKGQPAIDYLIRNDLEAENLRLQRNLITERVGELGVQLNQSLSQFEFDQADRDYFELKNLQRLVLILDDMIDGRVSDTTVPVYLVGSELLHEAFKKLSAIRSESILYATGNRFGVSYTVTRLIPLQLKDSQIAYARAEMGFSTKVLTELETYGGLLCCYFHVHPGRGVLSNTPSPIDLSCQARLEKGGYPTIGGIFSRDGYLPFFAHKSQFRIAISGKEMENVGKNLFKLKEIG